MYRKKKHFGTQLTIEGGSSKESKTAINLSSTTSFYQIPQRLEIDVFNLTHQGIPIDNQSFNTIVY